MMAPISAEVVGVTAVGGVPLVFGEHLTPFGSIPQPIADQSAVSRRQTPAESADVVHDLPRTCDEPVTGCGVAISGEAAVARYVARTKRERVRGIKDSFRGSEGSCAASMVSRALLIDQC